MGLPWASADPSPPLLVIGSRHRLIRNSGKAFWQTVYPIDPGLIPIYERVVRDNLGHSLETAVLIELLRRGCEVHCLRTAQGNEIDFHAVDASGNTLLVQVSANASDPATLQREVRSLIEARPLHPEAKSRLILLDPLPSGSALPAGIEVLPAIQWFLETPDHQVRSVSTRALHPIPPLQGLRQLRPPPPFSSNLTDNAPDGWSPATGTETVESIDSKGERVNLQEAANDQPKCFGRVRVDSGV